MSHATRRTFLAAAGTGAAATAAVVAAPPAFAAPAGDSAATATEPLVAFVHDPAAGRLTIMWGEDEVTITDIALVRRLARAVRS